MIQLPVVGVFGSGNTTHEKAYDLGLALSQLSIHLLTGGGEGNMEAVAKGFVSNRNKIGLSIGIIPGHSQLQASSKEGYPNPFIEIPIYTHLTSTGTSGMSHGSRNHINVLSSDFIIALPGNEGTISELMLRWV
jgi:uncharacterized protein (TIGR00725 family)